MPKQQMCLENEKMPMLYFESTTLLIVSHCSKTNACASSILRGILNVVTSVRKDLPSASLPLICDSNALAFVT